MSGTIETTNNNIVIKLTALNDLAKLLRSTNIEIPTRTSTQLETISEEYEMGSIIILSEYFMASSAHKHEIDCNEKDRSLLKKNMYFNKYQSFIRNESFISKMDKIFTILKKSIHDSKLAADKQFIHTTYAIIKIYNNSTVNKNIKEVVYENCTDCNTKMEIDSIASELYCKNCGMCQDLYGTVFEDDQFYCQEGQRTKHATYDPAKHCRFWVERIQARETTEIPESVLQRIRECITCDKITNKNRITCIQIRRYLRRTHNTKYNEHVPLIRKLITSIIPPQLNDHEMQLINIYFDKVIHIFDEIKPPEKTNCPYHPYFIYKIIEQILKNNTHRIRKGQILACIHLQSCSTLVTNDQLWAPICDRIPEFSYIPTDRNNQYEEF
jgi:hypothetical protein